MITMLNRSTGRMRLTKAKSAILASLIAGAITLPFIMPVPKAHADSERRQDSERDGTQLVGTWMANGAPGVAPGLMSFLEGGRVIWSRPVTVLTGPGTFALVSTGHGEWIRKGNNEFACTVFFLGSDTSAEFTTLIKVTETIKLNHNSNEFTQTGTVSGFDPNGNPLFSFPGPIAGGKRIVAGQ